MAKQFDAALKHLLEKYAADWLAYLMPQFGMDQSWPVEIVDANLSTITTEADKVLRVKAPQPWLLHLEMQASKDRQLVNRLLQYNVLLYVRHHVPVRSVVFLLRPEADGRDLTGLLRPELPNHQVDLDFHYHVVRLWEISSDAFLAGGLGLLPLAPLAEVEQGALPSVIKKMEQRFSHETNPGEANSLWTATYILLGLRYSDEFSAQLLKGVHAMEESVTYQAIIAEGEAKGKTEEARQFLVRMARKHLGPPPPAIKATIDSMSDPDQLEKLGERLLAVSSWDELLPASSKPKQNRKKRKPN
jgi:predicted transposase YdaD